MTQSDGCPDDLTRYCRRLGHSVPFKYCRLTLGDTPCGGILGCWGGHARAGSAAAEIAAGIRPEVRPPKAVQLYDLIRKAQQG